MHAVAVQVPARARAAAASSGSKRRRLGFGQKQTHAMGGVVSKRKTQHSVDYQRIVAQWFGEEDVAPKGEAADHARAAGEALAASFQRCVRRWAAGVLMRGGEAEAEALAEAEESAGALTEKLQVSVAS